MKAVDEPLPKHRQVYQALSRDIHSGRLKRGDRLPSEAELGRTFGASRITVGRAVRDLQLQGLVERRAGSGTYVTAGTGVRGMSFGLLIPDLGETDIFEPVCQGMMSSPLARSHALVWGSFGRSGATKSRSRVAAVPPVHRAAGVGCLLRAAGICGRPNDQSADRRGARRRAYSDRAPRSDGHALPAPRPSRSRRHRQPSRRLHRHRSPVAAEQPPAGFCRASRTPRRRSTRARPAIGRRSTLQACRPSEG